MVAFNFKEQFADQVEAGEKTQTIRERARCAVGQHLQLYTGQRTKHCRKLGDAVCTEVRHIAIKKGTLEVDGAVLMADSATRFAIADGFKDFREMAAFFHEVHGLPFYGFVINWRLLRSENLELTYRPESGPMMAPNDWPGVFIRGDNALHFASHLRAVLEGGSATCPDLGISREVIKGLAADLEACHASKCRPEHCTQIEIKAQPESR